MNTKNWTQQREFEWLQPGKPGEGYLLIGGGQRVGTMVFDHWSQASADGETSFGRWHLKRIGFWRPRFIIVDSQTGEEVALFVPSCSVSEGTLEIKGGERFSWKPRRFWGGEYALTEESGRTVFVLTRGLERFQWSDVFRHQGRIRLEGAVHDGKKLSILFLFAWWMILVLEEEGAAAAVVAMG